MSDVQPIPNLRWVLAFSRRWRLYLALSLGSILPLLLFLYAGDRLLRKIMIGNLLGQSQLAADTAGRVIESRLTDARLAVESFAANPVTVDAWVRRDMQRSTAQLRAAHDLEHKVTFWGMYDSKGFLRVGFPNPASISTGTSPHPTGLLAPSSRARCRFPAARQRKIPPTISLLLWRRH